MKLASRLKRAADYNYNLPPFTRSFAVFLTFKANLTAFANN